MDKTKALKEYAANVKTWYSSLTAHRAEAQEASTDDMAGSIEQAPELSPEESSIQRDLVSIFIRSADLAVDLPNYPFFLQCFNEHEATMAPKTLGLTCAYWLLAFHTPAATCCLFLLATRDASVCIERYLD